RQKTVRLKPLVYVANQIPPSEIPLFKPRPILTQCSAKQVPETVSCIAKSIYDCVTKKAV
ncbi:hypothetical protein, partial [Candidatus Symbiopectobacterium sp. NZEC135]|uniref:hypothetical protein n=1 Tax=Candidatus Symbiopectobacterium sp. NZEC135 TaxID=2820471 RepID=UPI002226F653